MTHNHSLPPYLYTPRHNDLAIALIKAQRLERRAEEQLIQQRLRRIKIEEELYSNMEQEMGQRCHAADVGVGIARALQRIAGVEMGREGISVDGSLGASAGSDTDASSTASDLSF
ncbi:hypothetical protein HYDPIDRAFT_108044 [Hydnomerulius pinastri MD-312]|nr:hypothetical protein HYDPIDRAFT_108044 [Hydnomerulius pinastri MD-312]